MGRDASGILIYTRFCQQDTNFGEIGMKTLSLEDAGKDLRHAFSEARAGAVRIVAPDGETVGVLLSPDEFRAMQIRLDLASDPAGLAQSDEDGRRFLRGETGGFEVDPVDVADEDTAIIDVRALVREHRPS